MTEGFQRTVSVPADPFSATKRLPFTQTPSFISANDAMREIFSKNKKGSSSVPSSPQQRAKRVEPDDDSDIDAEPLDANDDIDLDLDDEDDAASASAIRAKREAAKLQEEKAKREIKPLRRSASRGVQSLPASMFRFSHEVSNVKLTPTVAKITEEEDWSGSFGGSGGVPTAELKL